MEIDAVSVDGNVNEMVSDDNDNENKPVITNPLFDIVAIKKPADQTEQKRQPSLNKEVTATAQLTGPAKKGADDFLFDAELESKAMSAANAISWDEEEDPDEVLAGGASVNLSNNKNFWDAG